MYHTVAEFDSAIANLAAAHPALAQRIVLPEPSFEGQTIACLRIGSNGPAAADGALLIFGQHAREWVPPEVGLAFAADLLSACAANHDLVYGAERYTAAQAKQLVESINLFVVPCVNPDGRRYTQSSDDFNVRMWRRNRTTLHHPSCHGVDLNRNYDFMFDLDKYFSSASGVKSNTSKLPCDSSQTYQGPRPFSESETRNVKWLLDVHPRIRWFIDIHGYQGGVFYPFGDDENQTVNATMNWRNLSFDHQRGVKNDLYREYIAPRDLAGHAQLSSRLAQGIRAVRGTNYSVQQTFEVYHAPVAATSSDYAWSRHLAGGASPRIEAFAIEHQAAAPSQLLGFQPPIAEKDQIVSDLTSGLIKFCLAAVFQFPRFVLANLGYNAGNWRVDRHPRFVADLTGDGCGDIIGFGNPGVFVALNRGHGTFETLQLAIANLGYNAGGWRVDKHPRFVADLTGDGRGDIVGFGNAGVFVALNNGDGTFGAPQLVLQNLAYNAGSWRVDRHPRMLADLNADGCADIIGFGNAGVFVALNNGNGTFAAAQLAITDLGYNAGGWRVDRHPRFVADLTGDRCGDVIGFGNPGVFVARNNGDGTFQAPQLVLEDFGYNAGGWRVDRHPRLVADLTGDGCGDIIGFGNDGVFVARNNGDGTFQAPQLAIEDFGYNAGGWRVDRHPRFVADLTGDGRADIVGFGNQGVLVALNNGDGTFAPPQLVIEDFGYSAGSWRVNKHPRLVADLTGDRRADIIGFGDPGVFVALNGLTFL